MNPREKKRPPVVPASGCRARESDDGEIFLTLGIFISANRFAYLIRFEFNVPPVW